MGPAVLKHKIITGKHGGDTAEFSSADHDFNAPFCVYPTAIKLKEEGDGEEETSTSR